MSSNIRLTAPVKEKLKEFMEKEGINTFSDAVSLMCERCTAIDGLESIFKDITTMLKKFNHNSE